ncbi:serine kinase [Xanthomonas citri pv. glycines]|uniref:Serine kinase n=1 Tax=Xanthomonas campestris pv. glycines TaxID=473421 RepID=A0AAX0I4Q9_XANCG|nr:MULTISPECIES: Hpr(Ser) kinase/phosphatase [Xanthomonas]AOY63474.1 serine kinase [Xanthomonas citri pv. glycines str. 8ra]ARV22763.1 serine kinase [Xanthomonas citri pv. glycines str. 12-2]EWC53190.1 Hpr(Ser) kinase/phosphatase [Xanthomonas citri pv. glycines str. 8ra]KHS05789.1 serine kinase [Xanthomonas phaseoli pv. phaseoli]OEY98574.1 serine kinase [Xanthomonas citri pv. glycines]
MPQSAAWVEDTPLSDGSAAIATGAAVAADPFGEHRPRCWGVRRQILGALFHFQSDSQALLALVDAAYAGLPAHRLPGAPEFHVTLDLLPRAPGRTDAEPPPVRTHASGGLLCGIMDACNYLVLSVPQRRAMLVVSEDMLAHAYHVRYELIEFAVFLLAARGLGLVPLHGACVGRRGRSVLLLGASGAGKSTVALHSLLHGLDFVAEDGVFVAPNSLLTTGVANFLHLRAETLGLVDAPTRAWISASPVIRRRSGVEKFEVDLRHRRAHLAPKPMQLRAVVMVSRSPAIASAPHLVAVPGEQIAACLARDQPYAAGQPGWQRFVEQVQRIGMFTLHRGTHPQASVDALLQLLQ